MIAQVCCCLHHAPGVARGAHAPAFTGIGHEIVVPTIVTPRPGKPVRKNAAFQILAKGLTDIRLGGLVVALAVELIRAGQLKPSLEVLGNVLVQQRALRVARVVEFGFCPGLHVRLGMRLRWAFGGGHGAVQAGAGYLISPHPWPLNGVSKLCVSLVRLV